LRSVSPGYFRTMGIALLAGRDFEDADRDDSPEVLVINRTMARYYFRDRSAIGMGLAWWPNRPKEAKIIGVVDDVAYDGLRQPAPRMVYVSLVQRGIQANVIQLRAPSSAVGQDFGRAIHSVNPRISIQRIEPLFMVVRRILNPERLIMQVSAGFAIIALLLTFIGLYGVMAYTVARRTNEFGIRIALGAGPTGILRTVVVEGVSTVVAGLVTGLITAYAFSRLMVKFLFGVSPRDIPIFSLAFILLIAVAIAASCGPAYYAAKIEPWSALRDE
jgi:putative ABC transport system permease protein